MDSMSLINNDPNVFFHFERPRLNELFEQALKYPLVMVCAGAGYGKTSATHDFVEEFHVPTAWIQLSERDNVGERFWENFIHTIGQISSPFANAISKLGFPDNSDKLNQYLALVQKYLNATEKRILVIDDFHILENPSVIRFAERVIQNLSSGTLVIMISRSTPKINIAGLVSKGHIFNISENDLRFTESELAQYFRSQEILLRSDSLREIMQDTEGWAFAVNILVRSYKKAPGYGGYLRSAMKTNIFRLMETEIWDGISNHIQCFLVRLSLIGHLSFELIELLAGGEEELITEMERQNAYVRRDSYINAYLIHPLFLEFLSTKQDLLSGEQKRETYAIAGDWCNKNGFKIDALSYYEKISDYESIVSIFYSYGQLPVDIAKYGVVIFDRAPAEAFDKVVSLAVNHVRCYMRLGIWQRSVELMNYYEAKFLELPEDDSFRNRNLGGLYFLWAYLRNFMCLSDDIFDFDLYYEKFCKYHPQPAALSVYAIQSRVVGPWINANGSSKKGAPDEYIKAVSRAAAFLPDSFGGFMTGEEDLAWGELKFFQGDLSAAEAFIAQGIGKAHEHNQYEIIHRGLLYTLRISIAQGNYTKAEQTLKEMKAHMGEPNYYNRYINYDISLAWYYYVMDLPENIPDWLKQNISPYSHASFIENFENQMKARYCYKIRNYPPILAYVQEMKQRESYLYGLLVIMTMEACMYYKMKVKRKAFATLAEAYEIASPNNLIMPFIELGKDMRTLTAAALKDPDCSIPGPWLENINRKAASYAKRQAHVIAKYKQANRIVDTIAISPREADVLADLSQGLSRTEIANNRGLSINTVKMVINNIYSKLGAENLADLIRIAVEQKII